MEKIKTRSLQEQLDERRLKNVETETAVENPEEQAGSPPTIVALWREIIAHIVTELHDGILEEFAKTSHNSISSGTARRLCGI